MIDRDELQNLFCDIFPHINITLLERYVADEFAAADTNFSNGLSVFFCEYTFLQANSVLVRANSAANSALKNRYRAAEFACTKTEYAFAIRDITCIQNNTTVTSISYHLIILLVVNEIIFLFSQERFVCGAN